MRLHAIVEVSSSSVGELVRLEGRQLNYTIICLDELKKNGRDIPGRLCHVACLKLNAIQLPAAQ